MAYVTLIGKRVTCPKWHVPVTLDGKYMFSESNEYEAVFLCSMCPIVENSKLPLHKQCKEYKLMRCLEHDRCELLRDFPPKVDVRNGYSV
jgi:hypothetical protein